MDHMTHPSRRTEPGRQWIWERIPRLRQGKGDARAHMFCDNEIKGIFCRGYNIRRRNDHQIIYYIQELWNDGSLTVLDLRFGGGRTSKPTDNQKDEFRDMLSVNPMTTKDVRDDGRIWRRLLRETGTCDPF